jgi:hypothetical protein
MGLPPLLCLEDAGMFAFLAVAAMVTAGRLAAARQAHVQVLDELLIPFHNDLPVEKIFTAISFPRAISGI